MTDKEEHMKYVFDLVKDYIESGLISKFELIGKLLLEV